MVRVSPAARKSKVLSGALNVVAIDPVVPVLSLLTEVVSADASTAKFDPLGSVAPPDQVIEARLALTVLTLKWVKVNSPAGAVSRGGLAGGLMGFVAPRAPETTAASTRLIRTGRGVDVGGEKSP